MIMILYIMSVSSTAQNTRGFEVFNQDQAISGIAKAGVLDDPRPSKVNCQLRLCACHLHCLVSEHGLKACLCI